MMLKKQDTHQFRSEGRFNVSRGIYNVILSGYKSSYDNLVRESAGNDLKSALIRLLLETEFINPYQLQLR